MSPKHLKRYIHEFAYRHNTSKIEVMECIGDTITKMVGKRMMSVSYTHLTLPTTERV